MYCCRRKYTNEKARIKDGKVEFECAWLADPTKCRQHITFPLHLQMIDDMVKWVREAICNHQILRLNHLMKTLSTS
jgi:hypothetical protein